MSELRLKSTGTIKLFENDNTSSVTIASPASLGADRTITLPDASVTLASGTMLATDGDGSSLTGLTAGQIPNLAASKITSGTIDTARLGSGTASSSTVLYGDQTYKAEPGGTNTPYFHMKTSTSDQTITEDVWTKVALSVEVLDSDGSAVDTTNYKYTIPSGEGGKWFIGGQVSYYFSNNDLGATYFKITGTTEVLQCLPYVASVDNDTRHCTYAFQGIFNYSASDYIELYVYMQAHGGVGPCALYTGLTNSNNMYGYKLIT